MKKEEININLLKKQYEVDLMTLKELSVYYEMSVSTIRRLMIKNGVEIRERGNIKEKEYHLVSPLKQSVNDIDKMVALFNKCLPVNDIAKELNVSPKAVYRTIKEMNLVRPKSMYSREQYNNEKDEEIIKLYNEGKSSTEIGKILNLTHRTILNHLKHCDVKRRTLSQSQFNYHKKDIPKELEDFETLYDMYVINRMSKKSISEQLKVAPHVIDRVLKAFGIHVRNDSECKVGLMVGPNHPNWKGGRTLLYVRIREYFRIKQVKQVIERDGKKCTICGSKKKLHVHHIKPFKEIFQEILNEHPDLDVIKDAEELYQTMVNDWRFNDLDNLVTYCKDCHLYKIHGYVKKIV